MKTHSEFRRTFFTILALALLVVAVVLIPINYGSRLGDNINYNTIAVASTNYVENVTADTYTYRKTATQKYGSSKELTSSWYYPSNATKLLDHRTIYLKFDLTDSRYVGQKLDSASLKFTGKTTSAKSVGIRIIKDTDWSESTADYNTFNVPDLSPAQVFYEYPLEKVFSVNSANVSVDLTKYISPLLGSKFVVIVENLTQTPYTIYSKENTSGKSKPRIELSYSPIVNPPTPTGTLAKLKPTEIPFSNKEITNPLRGLYQWRGSNTNPNSTPIYDVYERFNWNTLEPKKGTYDFSAIRNQVNNLKSGQKFAFRVRAMEDNGNVLPSDMQNAPYTQVCNNEKVPNWNSPELIERMRLLLEKLGSEFNNTKISYVDIGMYGRFGESHMYGYPSSCEATVGTLQKLADYHFQYFPDVQLLMLYNNEASNYILNTKKANKYGPVGIRTDTIGDNELTFHVNITAGAAGGINYMYNRWETAPFVTEFVGSARMEKTRGFVISLMEAKAWHFTALGNGNTFKWSELNSTQQTQFNDLAKSLGYRFVPREFNFYNLKVGQNATLDYAISNVGNTPTYEPWNVKLKLTNTTSSTKTVTYTLNTNLRQLYPTLNQVTGKDAPVTFRQTLDIPSSLTKGTYKVELYIEDSRTSNKRLPLYLAINGRQSSGYYNLGTVTIN